MFVYTLRKARKTGSDSVQGGYNLQCLDAICQIRLGQVRLGQVRLGQVRLGQVRSRQVRLGQVTLGQVRSRQVRLGYIASFRTSMHFDLLALNCAQFSAFFSKCKQTFRPIFLLCYSHSVFITLKAYISKTKPFLKEKNQIPTRVNRQLPYCHNYRTRRKKPLMYFYMSFK